jgi:hypothetical protein
MEEKTSPERLELLLSIFDQGHLLFTGLPVYEKKDILEGIFKSKDPEWALKAFQFQKGELTQEQIDELKSWILQSEDVDVACSAFLNHRRMFTEKEVDLLRSRAITTTNEYCAYYICQTDWSFLLKHPEIRKRLRDVVIHTKDPEKAVMFLNDREDNLLSINDDAKSLEYTVSDLRNFIEVVIRSKKPDNALSLLYQNQNTELYTTPLALLPEEVSSLKRIIIESGNTLVAHYAFTEIICFSEGEKMVLKGITLHTTEPDQAARLLCDTDFIPHINEQQRNTLRELASKTKDRYLAGQSLKYIYDLTPEEHANLELIANSK